MTQSCRDCGTQFDGRRWQRLCWTCWREQRDRNAQDDGYRRGWTDGLAAGRRHAPALTAALLRDAVALCHPDRHPPERAAEANATTAALLELRAEVAA